MLLRCALLVTVVAACTSSSTDDPSTGGGKADGEDAACTTQYVEWLLTTYKPEVVAGDWDATAALAANQPCRGVALTGVAWTTWLDVTELTAFAPYTKQHADALVAFQLATSPTRGDYTAYLRATAVTDAVRRALTATQAVRPIVAADGQAMQEWWDLYHAQAEEVLTPLQDLALISTIEDGYTVNAGEGEMLDLVATTRPTTTRDGAFATWIEAYDDVLQHGFTIDTEDDYRSGVVSSVARERVLDRVAALAPASHGDDDSRRWMYALDLWASLAASSQPPFAATDAAQLARIDAVRPAMLGGEPAYKEWLEAVADANSNASVLAASVVPAKPCAAGADADADYAAWRVEHTTIAIDAAPHACD